MSRIQLRREQMLQLLMSEGSMQVTDLVKRFNVSAVTVRTDLDFFEEQGLVTRAYGGAAIRKSIVLEHDLQQKGGLNHSIKERIGMQAAKLVKPGDNIIIDSGTTTCQLARAISHLERVTVMTNGLNVACELAESDGVELILTGGILRKKSQSFQGAQAESSLSRYRFDKLFLGVDGLDIQQGITTHSEAEASLNRRMVEVAKETIVMTDSSKFDSVCLHRIMPLTLVRTVITDSNISTEYHDALLRAGVDVILVD